MDELLIILGLAGTLVEKIVVHTVAFVAAHLILAKFFDE